MSETIQHYINNINTDIFLPGIQRRFVWSEDKIAKLFDSLLNEFPIGSLVRYRADRTDDNYIAYKFITKFIDEEERIPKDIEESYTEFQRENEILEDGETKLQGGGVFRIDNQNHTLIIDGQQRLTALNIGYNGSLLNYYKGSSRKKSKSRNWERRYLCIDVLSEQVPIESEDDSGGEKYTDVFEFKSAQELDSIPLTGGEECPAQLHLTDATSELWVSVPEITKPGTTGLRDGIKNDLKASKSEFDGYSGEFSDEQKSIIGDVFNDFDKISDKEIPDETWDDSYAGVPEIFSRINTEGETVENEDLLMMEFMQNWAGDEDIPSNRIPRLLIDEMVTDIQRHNETGFEDKVDWELLLTVICNVNGHKLTKAKAKNPDLDSMRDILYGDDPRGDGYVEFKNAVQEPLVDLNQLDLSSQTVPKKLLAALSVYYLSVERDDSVQIDDAKNKNNLSTFIAASQLLNSIDSEVMRRSKPFDAISAIKDDSLVQEAFPINEALNNIGGVPSKSDLQDLVDEKRYAVEDSPIGRSSDGVLAVLGLLDWFDDVGDCHIDHIFPQSKSDELGVSKDTLHRIGNLQLLDESKNEEKGELFPREWFSDELSKFKFKEYERNNVYLGYSPEEVQEICELQGSIKDDLEEGCETFIKQRELLVIRRIQDIFKQA